ncbi:MAG: 1-deoxy-D-xylulose-5-phosphate reductoisomerase [Proteobacteria bacterium]|nr:1-deoxy-D-xylulose-5-phosphate reductoisomerase [Pseudomonadota bacterium]
MKKISILGSTGSIGQSTLDVVARNPDRFEVVGLAEGHDVELLARQIERFRPAVVSVRDAQSAARLREIVRGHMPEILFGIEGACRVAEAPEAALVVSAIVGAAGLLPTLRAIEARKNVALANKETMVVAGALVSSSAARMGVAILPVDSEHAAIHQSLAGHRREDVTALHLTASGGPFLRASMDQIRAATPKQAIAHPRWNMGAKITIDSATLMNKGLEVMEARWLFSVPQEKIRVIVHPQSIVHSLVEYRDGCVMAQLGMPDMRAPIAYAISWPERVESGCPRLDLAAVKSLTFEEPDLARFPCLSLAYQALQEGDSMPAVLNAANEVAVEAFLDGRIGFMEIARVVDETMSAHDKAPADTLDMILEADRWAREHARGIL